MPQSRGCEGMGGSLTVDGLLPFTGLGRGVECEGMGWDRGGLTWKDLKSWKIEGKRNSTRLNSFLTVMFSRFNGLDVGGESEVMFMDNNSGGFWLSAGEIYCKKGSQIGYRTVEMSCLRSNGTVQECAEFRTLVRVYSTLPFRVSWYQSLLVSWMVTDLEDSKTHIVGGVWSGEYMDHGFTKSMSELDRCYTMLQELRSVIAIVQATNPRSAMEELKNEMRKRRRIDINNLVSRKLVDILKLSMEICPIEGYQVCKVPVTIGKSYKVEVLCIVDDIDECHILLGRPWQCEVNGKYDLKKNLYLFSWKGRRIAMVPPKVTPQLPKPEVKVEEKIVKAEVVDEHIEKIQDLQSYKQHDDKILTLLCETTNKVGTLKTCEEIIGFNDDEDVKGFNCELKTDFKCVHDLNVRDLDSGLIFRMIIKNHIKFSMVNKEAIFITTENLVVADKEHTTRCFGSWINRWEYGKCIKKYEGFRVDVKRKSIEDKVRREKVFEVEEVLNIENSRASSFQVWGINVNETKVNAVRDWSSFKIFPEVRNNKVADAFQEEYELQCAEPLDGEAEQVAYVVQQTLCSPKVDQEGTDTLKVTEICKVPLAIGKHYNELVTCDVVNMEQAIYIKTSKDSTLLIGVYVDDLIITGT
ncbi:hypothetical protein Tco_1037982, partial [Tanacetum coccineum]